MSNSEMFQKLNVYEIIKSHLSTLKDASTGQFSRTDFVIQYFVPGSIAFLYFFTIGEISSELASRIDSSLIAAFAIFTALLLNLQVLIISDASKDKASRTHQAPSQSAESIAFNNKNLSKLKDLRSELFFNVSYAILLSLFIVLISIASVVFDFSQNVYLKSAAVYLLSHFSLVILMVLKRTQAIFTELLI